MQKTMRRHITRPRLIASVIAMLTSPAVSTVLLLASYPFTTDTTRALKDFSDLCFQFSLTWLTVERSRFGTALSGIDSMISTITDPHESIALGNATRPQCDLRLSLFLVGRICYETPTDFVAGSLKAAWRERATAVSTTPMSLCEVNGE